MSNNEETALARQSNTVIVPRSLDEVVTLSEKIAKSGLLPEALRNKVPEVMMQIMAGQELGLAPMASLRSFSIINGKPVMSADAMVAIVLGSGKAEYFRRLGEGSDKSVTYVTKRKGQEEQRCTWTIEMAKTAALHQKDNWRTFPRAMLASRAKAELARDVYSDILAGVFTADEVTEGYISPTTRTDPDVIEAEFVDSNQSDPPEVTAIDDMNTVEELKAHAAKIAALKLTGSAKDRATRRYNERMAVLKRQADPAVAAEQTTEPAA
ncbi:MAG TPA: hypothetical protein VFT22_01285 [Kofleriaceae bacterium]|nr:hypothetical protein [Kofleriaceae bacterium]